jgi:hypothetical protein
MATEYIHGFGALDLYDQDRDEPSIKVGGTGKFDVMSNLLGWKRNERIPGMLNAFTRVFIGWLEPIYIFQDGYYPIQPCEISSQIYVIKKNFPNGEYIYIENRQPYRWYVLPTIYTMIVARFHLTYVFGREKGIRTGMRRALSCTRLTTTRISNLPEDIRAIRIGPRNTIRFPYCRPMASTTWNRGTMWENKATFGRLARNCHPEGIFPIATVYRLASA